MIKQEDLEKLLQGYKTRTEQLGMMISLKKDPKSVEAITDYLDSQSVKYRVFHEISVVATEPDLTEEQLRHVAGLDDTQAIEWGTYLSFC